MQTVTVLVLLYRCGPISTSGPTPV